MQIRKCWSDVLLLSHHEILEIPCGATEGPLVSGMASTEWAVWKARLKAKSAGGIIALKKSVLQKRSALTTGPPITLLSAPSMTATVEKHDVVNNLA